MTGSEPALRRESGRILLLGSFVLAVLAAAALALGTDEARLLRLGIVAALWATLLGAFAVVRMRREMSSSAERTEELRVVYQLELDREIAARREHELKVERELREQVEQREQREINALRGELAALRDTLRTLLGGDVLVERVALRAESTRLLPIPEHSRTGGEGQGRMSVTNTAPRVGPGLLSAESALRATGPAKRDSWDREQPDIADITDIPEIYAQTEAELSRETTNGRTKRKWNPAVSSAPSWRSAFDPEPPEDQVPRQISQGGRHSRQNLPRYSSNAHESTTRETNGNGSSARRPVQELLASYGEGRAPRHRHGRESD